MGFREDLRQQPESSSYLAAVPRRSGANVITSNRAGVKLIGSANTEPEASELRARLASRLDRSRIASRYTIRVKRMERGAWGVYLVHPTCVRRFERAETA
ncbi:hypothetical protein G4Z16_29920 [Streptomyces bathyalis]|uniref:Uncharacterized protein n=1 Tax=Streptomyces bathyalis TaxID=2710756 RepID=A0A7T1TBL2_9ACTN|nr:hypothetical protein [Streptomyces bathyalis]QPP09935.1 hypothetical protein G4Z16_29920 [Streptomyces bathyalis]